MPEAHHLYPDRDTQGRFIKGHKKLGGRRWTGRPRNAMRSLNRFLAGLTTKGTPSEFRQMKNRRNVRAYLRSFPQP